MNRIKYYFENFVSRKSNFVYFLFVTAVLYTFLMVAVEYILEIVEDDAFTNIWWSRFEKILEIDADGENLLDRLVNFLYWIFSVAFSGTIIAFLAAKVANFIEDLKKGNSQVIDSNHYVIIGWNSTIFKIFDEIQLANENQTKPTVLCYNSMDNIEMNQIIEVEYKNKKNLRIITRSGSIYSIHDLGRCNLNKAKSIIILDDIVVPDFNIETTILAVKRNVGDRNIPLISQFRKEDNIKLMKNFMGNNFYPINTDDIIAKVTAQVIRNKFISSIVLDFLDYDGDEIYFMSSKNLQGKTFKQAMLLLKSVTLIGIKTKDENVFVNPDKDYIIMEEDSLIVIAEDDNFEKSDNKSDVVEIENHVNAKLNNLSIIKENIQHKERLSLLVIGWSQMGQRIIDCTLPFLAEGSNLVFAYQERLITAKPQFNNVSGIDIKEVFLIGEGRVIIEEVIKGAKFDVVVLLGYDDVLNDEVADTKSLMQCYVLRSIIDNLQSNKPRVILQLNDGSKQELIQNENSNEELIVSDLLSSLLTTQLADNPKLWYVFDDLFNGSGFKINVEKLDNFILNFPDFEITKVEDLLLLALGVNKTFIGYIQNEQLFLNPHKGMELSSIEDISIVYIA